MPNIDPQPTPTRRRRVRRLIIPSESGERATFLDRLARRTLPTFDFFLFSLLAGTVLAGGILLDSPALFFLGALVAPFMAPLIGISLSSVIGSGWFFLQTLAGTLVGGLMVFITGGLAGLASYLLPQLPLKEASLRTQITWPDFLVLTLGIIFSMVSMARSEQKPLLPSAILAYELYLPVGVAGFGLSIHLIGGSTNLWPAAIIAFGVYLIWTILLGIVTLWIVGIRPLNFFGYVFGALIILISLVVGLGISGFGSILGEGKSTVIPTQVMTNTQTRVSSPTMAPSTLTPTSAPATSTTLPRTPTHTLVPSATPTETLTPAPTSVWAIVRANNGAYVREEPNFTAKIVDGVLGGSLVQILPETSQEGGTTWVHILTKSNIKGWIVQSILETATPVPNW